MTLRRVRKEDVQTDMATKPDGVAECLECWKDYMMGDDRDLSASRMKLGSVDSKDREAYQSDPWADQRKADLAIGEATGAVIDGLRQHLQWAIKKQCGITTIWKFPMLDFVVVAGDARTELEIKLRKNIATACKFE